MVFMAGFFGGVIVGVGGIVALLFLGQRVRLRQQSESQSRQAARTAEEVQGFLALIRSLRAPIAEPGDGPKSSGH